MASTSFTPLTTVIAQFSKSYGLEMKILESHLQQEWSHIVGSQLAAHTWPDAVKFKKLFLLAENSVWLQQLMFLKPALLEKLHGRVNGSLISDIVLRVGEIPVETVASRSYEHGPAILSAPSTEHFSFATALTSTIKSQNLQRLLIQVIAKSLSFREHASSSPHSNRD